MAKTDKTPLEQCLDAADRLTRLAKRSGGAPLYSLMARHLAALHQMNAEQLAIDADLAEPPR